MANLTEEEKFLWDNVLPLIHPSLIKECVEFMDKLRIKTLLYRSDPE